MNLSMLSKYSNGDLIDIQAMFDRVEYIDKVQYENKNIDLSPYHSKRIELEKLGEELFDLLNLLKNLGYKCATCKYYLSNEYHCGRLPKTSTVFSKSGFCKNWDKKL